MTGIYLFAAAAGVPLVVWFLLSGADDGSGDGGGSDDGSGGGDGIGAVMLRMVPLSTVAIAVAMFGITGLVLGAVGSSSAATLAAAIAIGIGAGVLNSTVFGYLKRSSSTAAINDDQVIGAAGRAVLPIAPDRRGRVVVEVGDQRLYFSAVPFAGPDGEPTLDVGDPILVVQIANGVASVTRLDPELT